MTNHDDCCLPDEAPDGARRTLFKSVAGMAALGLFGGLALALPDAAMAAAMTKEERDSLSPDQIIEAFKQGNARFRSGKMHAHDYLAQKRASASGQYPAAVILSCIDSRAPAEIILDVGIGETFAARVAGNVVNDDVLGSLEFACALAGAKLVVVMGHSACGAIKGAIDNAELGNLTGLLDKIKPAVKANLYAGERSSKNADFVDSVARSNVLLAISEIRERSKVLETLEKDGKIKIVGAMYQLVGGRVDFFS